MAEFLFEIGFEEMPAPWLSGMADQLRAKFAALASDEQLDPAEVRVLWTSRRLVLVAEVKPRQDDRTVVEWGPAAKIARDASGAWSKAAEGFAKKQGVHLEALVLAAKTPGGADLYVSATRAIAGRPAADVLANLLPQLLRGFNFPKRMNWDAWLDDGRGAFEFGRPIQWIVALLDGVVIPLTIFDAVAGAKGAARVTSGRRSMGHRFCPRGATDRGFDVRSFAELQAGLKATFVILDPAERAAGIQAQVAAAGGDITGDSRDLLLEWADLVEYPTVVIGTIPREFAHLPDEVLETVLAHHQKAVTLPRASDGSPRFAAISGGDQAASANVVQGQERVVVARLKDARFFYEEDRKRTLESRVDDLAAVTFHKGLGSYKDKVDRMAGVATRMMDYVVLSSDRKAWLDASVALRLCKADLTTHMVREFPELQGVIGGLYSRPTQPPAISAAIATHYRLSIPADSGESTGWKTSMLTSMVDKLDTLIGYFRIGAIPTGSADPYGLRRAALGFARTSSEGNGRELAQVLVEERLDQSLLKLDTLANLINDAYSEVLPRESAPGVVPKVGAFLLERLRGVIAEAAGGAVAVADAVLAARRPLGSGLGDADPFGLAWSLRTRAGALARITREQPEVIATVASLFKRAKNLVGEPEFAPSGGISGGPLGNHERFLWVNPETLKHPSEHALLAGLERIDQDPDFEPAARLEAVARLRAPMSAFFDNVLVNDPNDSPDYRRAKVRLLQMLVVLVIAVADLSKLASPSGESPTSS